MAYELDHRMSPKCTNEELLGIASREKSVFITHHVSLLSSLFQSCENMICIRIMNLVAGIHLQEMFLSRQIIVCLIALAILTQQGSKTFILLDYLSNKKYVTSVLCENRDRPLLHCNGKCYLKKEFKKNDKQQGNEKQSNNLKDEINCWEQHSLSSFNLQPFSQTISSASGINQGYYSAPLSAPFHPPC